MCHVVDIRVPALRWAADARLAGGGGDLRRCDPPALQGAPSPALLLRNHNLFCLLFVSMKKNKLQVF